MTSLIPLDLLARWPGRFRFAGLLAAFGSDAAPTAADCADALLRGAIYGHDAEGAVRSLIDDGRFAVAEEAVGECADFDDVQRAELRGLLDRERIRVRQELADRLARIAITAEHAEVETQLHQAAVERKVEDGRNLALELIEAEEGRLARLVEEAAEELRDELRAVPNNGTNAWSRACAALIDDGNLRAARRVLRSREAGRLGPGAVPSAGEWRWSEPATEVLSWYAVASRERPPSFAAWAATSSEALEIAKAMHELVPGSTAAAGRLAGALEVFVNVSGLRSADAPGGGSAVTPVGDGWLAELRGVFADHEVTPVETHSVVDLYIAPRGQTEVPEALYESLSAPFLAVGPDLTRPDIAARSKLAVITLQDLLLLIRQDVHRRAQLLRLAGPQWPLSALSAGSPTELHRLLEEADPTDEDRWSTLSWVLDLAGLRDAWLADALAYQSGLVHALLDVFLQHLTQVQPGTTRRGRRQVVSEWVNEPQLAVAVERAVLAPLGRPEQAIAFWAALAEGSALGSNVREEDVLVSAELAAEEAELAVDEVLPLVETGVRSLTQSPLVDRPAAGILRLRPCGVLVALTAQADQRLHASLLAALLRQRTTARIEVATSKAQLRWRALRHAVGPGYLHAVDRIDHGSDSDAEQAMRDLEAEADLLDVGELPVDGRCDLASVLDDLGGRFMARSRAIRLTADSARPSLVPYRREVLETIIWELIDRAEQTMQGRAEGRIWVTSRPAGEDIEIEVRDDGPGLAIQPGKEHRLWRSNPGLERARRVAQRCGGDLLILTGQGGHPTYPGAHFMVVLPA